MLSAPLAKAILESPAGREAAARLDGEIAARRTALAKRHSVLEKDAEKAFHRHAAAERAAFAEVEAARAALRVATARMGSLLAARGAENHAFDTEIADIEAQLRATADPATDAAIAELRDEFDKTLKTRAPDDVITTRNPVTGEVEVKPGPRRVLPAERAQAIRDAIAALEGLKLQADQSDIAERIAAIRTAIPTVGAPHVAND